MFRAAMILLRGSTPGPLDEYEEATRAVCYLYGEGAWGIIARADDFMRPERWERLRRGTENEIARGVCRFPFDSGAPWAAVIRDSAPDHRNLQKDVKDLVRLVPRAPREVPRCGRAG